MKFKSGLIIGRFSPIQLGHNRLIEKSLELCEKVLILVGSAQESQTLRNPFDFETRTELIKISTQNLPNKSIKIEGINDLKNELNNTFSWGDYVKAEVIKHQGYFPDLLIYGNDTIKRSWFSPDELAKTETYELFAPRDNISGTYVRGLLVINDESEWKKVTSPYIHSKYHELRSKLLNVPIYEEIYKTIKSNLTIDKFMNVYSEFEKEDKKKKLLNLQ